MTIDRTMSTPEEHVVVVNELFNRIAPLLAGHPPEVQGAVLADLLATWLGGHIIPDRPKETAEAREELLTMHIAEVRHMLPMASRRIHERNA